MALRASSWVLEWRIFQGAVAQKWLWELFLSFSRALTASSAEGNIAKVVDMNNPAEVTEQGKVLY